MTLKEELKSLWKNIQDVCFSNLDLKITFFNVMGQLTLSNSSNHHWARVAPLRMGFRSVIIVLDFQKA